MTSGRAPPGPLVQPRGHPPPSPPTVMRLPRRRASGPTTRRSSGRQCPHNPANCQKTPLSSSQINCHLERKNPHTRPPTFNVFFCNTVSWFSNGSQNRLRTQVVIPFIQPFRIPTDHGRFVAPTRGYPGDERSRPIGRNPTRRLVVFFMVLFPDRTRMSACPLPIPLLVCTWRVCPDGCPYPPPPRRAARRPRPSVQPVLQLRAPRPHRPGSRSGLTVDSGKHHRGGGQSVRGVFRPPQPPHPLNPEDVPTHIFFGVPDKKS